MYLIQFTADPSTEDDINFSETYLHLNVSRIHSRFEND